MMGGPRKHKIVTGGICERPAPQRMMNGILGIAHTLDWP
jgi:hypothetical protein